MTIYMELTNTVRPISEEHLAAYVERYATDELPIARRHGFELVGSWRRMSGPVNTLLSLYRFDDLASWNEKWAGFQADPDYHAYLGKMGSDADLTRFAGTFNLGAEIPVVSEPEPVRGSTPRQYVETAFRVQFGAAPEVYALVAEATADATAFRPVLAYQRMTGIPEVVVIGASTVDGPPVGYSLGTARADLRARLQELVVDETVTVLSPVPCSPMQ